jgi:flavin reductase (DIM6/NTAB) family NADH-FMN oxidoreductase RutF/ADP-ribose pyrophosphatase YjhB (NUDIX family)
MNNSRRDAGPGPAVDVQELRRTLSAFVTGVTVVTTVDAEGRPRGMTANSFTSVSLDPPLVLVCIASTAGSFTAFSESRSFAINILAEGQEELANRFASKRPDKFTGLDWSGPTTGAPVLGKSLAWLDCTVHRRSIAGDHMILIGRVEDISCGTSRPLAFCQGNYVRFGLAQDAMSKYVTKRLLTGWIVESEGQILLARPEDDPGAPPRWSIPMSSLPRAYETADAIDAAARESIGADVDISFLYSAIDLHDQEALCLVYRGEAHGKPHSAGARSRIEGFAPSAIPWSRIPDRHIRNMLRRYLQERLSDRFGIYLGSVDDGRVAMVGPHEPWTVHARTLSDIESADPQSVN